jgi:hypothetical protein
VLRRSGTAEWKAALTRIADEKAEHERRLLERQAEAARLAAAREAKPDEQASAEGRSGPRSPLGGGEGEPGPEGADADRQPMEVDGAGSLSAAAARSDGAEAEAEAEAETMPYNEESEPAPAETILCSAQETTDSCPTGVCETDGRIGHVTSACKAGTEEAGASDPEHSAMPTDADSAAPNDAPMDAAEAADAVLEPPTPTVIQTDADGMTAQDDVRDASLRADGDGPIAPEGAEDVGAMEAEGSKQADEEEDELIDYDVKDVFNPEPVAATLGLTVRSRPSSAWPCNASVARLAAASALRSPDRLRLPCNAMRCSARCIAGLVVRL